MAKVDMWMPLYIADYLADTSRLTTVQHGAYLLLMMDYWRNGPPPDDDDVLSQITKVRAEEWPAVRRAIAGFFEIDGFWVHGRIDSELQKAKDFREKQKANGKLGGRPKANQTEPKENPTVNPEHNPDESPSPTPSPTPIQPPAPKPKRTVAATRLPEDWKLPVEWAEWAIQQTPSVNVILEAATFRDYWVAKSGKDATKNSWEATWRNWCRRVQQRAGNGPRQFLTTTQRIQKNNEQAFVDFLSDSGAIEHDPN